VTSSPRTKTTLDRVREILCEQLGVDETEVTPETPLREGTGTNELVDLGADSLDVVELVMGFEEEFDLEIPDHEAEKIKTVQDVVDYLDKHVKPIK
jgi:acyl carrier protein